MKLPTLAGVQASRPTKAKHVEAAHLAIEKESEIRLNVAIPESLHRAVKTKTSQEGKTIKQVVLAFLEEYSKK